MHRVLSARWLSGALRVGEARAATNVPLFLCPALSRSQRVGTRSVKALAQRRELHIEPGALAEDPAPAQPTKPTVGTPAKIQSSRNLPLTCTGCGAFSQTSDPNGFGFYNLENKRVRKWLNAEVVKDDRPAQSEEKIVNEALGSMSTEELAELGIDPTTMLHGELLDQEAPKNAPAPKSLVCDRCHTLEHNNTTDIQMFHPTVESLRETIEE